MTPARSALVARTEHVAGVELISLADGDGPLLVRSGTGLAGRGAAARVRLAEAGEALAAIEVDDPVGRPGTGAVAFGALPFWSTPDTELIVPEVVWGRSADGTAWRTTITRGGEPSTVDLGARRPETWHRPDHVRVAPTRPPARWCDLVARAAAEIRAAGDGGLHKVVLAREVEVRADRRFDVAAVLRHLAAGYPDCYLFHADGFLGASPELLVERRDDVVRSQPMAGTAPRGADPTTDARLASALLGSDTYRHEHQLTIDMVYDTLLPWCSYLDYEAEPSVVQVANVQHLATLVEGRLSVPAPSVLDLVRALHPTPAVAGWPRSAALDWIARHEGIERGRYAGTVGWVDGRGNGTWAVSIRCAQIDGDQARLWAGNGIVADSDPATELAETEAKLQALLGALGA